MQNVFWNLAIGVGSIGLLRRTTGVVSKLAICSLSLFLVIIIRADFSWYELMMIYIFFFWREKVWKLVGVGLINIVIGGIQTFVFLGLYLFYFITENKEGEWGIGSIFFMQFI